MRRRGRPAPAPCILSSHMCGLIPDKLKTTSPPLPANSTGEMKAPTNPGTGGKAAISTFYFYSSKPNIELGGEERVSHTAAALI